MDMWALSKLRLEPGDLWLDEYFDATEAQLTRFTLRVSSLFTSNLSVFDICFIWNTINQPPISMYCITCQGCARLHTRTSI
jgi:hypothetical protein